MHRVHDTHNRGAPPEAAPSAADELAKFAALRDSGVLTDDEFQAIKQKLIN
jgi:Short C-terminal domain